MIKALTNLLLGALFFASALHADESIRIGIIAPLTGDAASWGTDARNAAQLALADAKASKLTSEGKVSIVYEDGRCTGKDGATAASKLINVDRVQLIIAAGCSGEVLGAAPIAQRAQVVLIASLAESSEISRAGSFVFRLGPNVANGAKNAAAWMSENNLRRIAILSENSDFAANLRTELIAQLQKLDEVALVADVTFNPGESNFRLLLQTVRSKKPDVLFLNPQTGASAGLIIKQLREQQWEIPVFGNFALGTADSFTAAGGIKLLEGVRFIDYPSITSESVAALNRRVEEQFTTPQTDYIIAFNYDAVMIALAAIKRVGNNGEALRDYLQSTPSHRGIAMNYRFDSNGDALGLDYSRKIIRNGAIEVISPQKAR